ncbi:MAG: hypothetical protein IJ819_00085 [Clostridiales bacterium]|nr:hypothetical protein [Clostridiales bacterium]
MYSASATFNTLIKKTERTFAYSGSIEATGGQSYTYAGSDLCSGRLFRAISNDSLEIGTVYAAEYDCDLALGISRYELYNGVITLDIELEGAADVIPMGEFNISKINQTADRLQIKSYDNMVKFNKSFSKASDNAIRTPYVWLDTMCTACGVVLGSTPAEIKALPNGTRLTAFADVVTDVETWRDVLHYLAVYLASYAYIGRDGKLYLSKYKGVSSDTIPASFRYASELSDFRTTYDGLYAVYKAEGMQEYVSNTNSGGLVLDIGINPFLQFTNAQSRISALQEIIDAFDGIYYVPYSSTVPMNPLYDVGDVITFTGNQADAYDYGAITEIDLTIGSSMRVTCAGDNPRLAAAQDRFSKSVEGLSSEYSNGQEIGGKNYWKLISNNTSDIEATSSKTQVAEIEWNQITDVQKIGMMYTCTAIVSATATVQLELSVDDEANYTFVSDEEKLLLGKRIISATCGFQVEGKGQHTAKAYMTVTDSPLLWGDLA